MIIMGIDYSMNSPGITRLFLDEKLNVYNKHYLGFTQIKKQESTNSDGEIVYYKKNQFSNSLEQSLWMSNTILQHFPKCDYAAIEGYAMSAYGRVFDIAEATAIMKLHLYNNDTKIRIYDPCSIKMYYCGKGNGDKISMEDTFENGLKKERFNLDFLPQYKSPKVDIIDSYAIANLLQVELKLRKGLIQMKDLSEIEIKIFNRVTKGNPINILAQDFIERK